jgi:iron-sulfur cluster repair protein YtfE (RIC family)
MKRDPALIPLTHDHHHALAQARRLRTAATGDSATRRDGAAAFLDFFDTETISHFREEEELLFPLLVEVSEAVPDLLARVLVEHVQIHCLVRRLRRDFENDGLGAAGMIEVGERLEAHIRFEERQLFPLIEQAVPASLLGELNFPPRHRGDGGQEAEGSLDAPG